MRAALITVDPERPDPAKIAAAASVLSSGGLVAFPTETVYGLGADARSEQAVGRVFAVKGRPMDNPLIVHLAEAGLLSEVAASIPALAAALAEEFWPGPLTLVVEAAPAVLPATAGLTTVAVRVPDHPVALALLEAAAAPVAAPSANRSGRPSPTRAAHVVADLGDDVDVVLDGGPCLVGVESTVVDVRGDRPVVLREGAVTREEIARVVGLDPAQGSGEALLAAPGTRHRHYRPACEVILAEAGEAPAVAARLAAAGRAAGLISSQPAPEGVREILRFSDPSDLARQLYDALRAAEGAGVDVVVIEAVPESGIGRAVMDRLRRAAG